MSGALGITRLGTLLLRLRDSLATLSGSLEAAKIKATGEQLAALRDLAQARATDLLVLVIPRQTAVDIPSEEYLAALSLMGAAGLPYINPSPLLDATADYDAGGDGHWNNAGHQKVGAQLSDCLRVYAVTGDLADCDAVVMPGDQRS